jgi:hypothetical protein
MRYEMECWFRFTQWSKAYGGAMSDGPARVKWGAIEEASTRLRTVKGMISCIAVAMMAGKFGCERLVHLTLNEVDQARAALERLRALGSSTKAIYPRHAERRRRRKGA